MVTHVVSTNCRRSSRSHPKHLFFAFATTENVLRLFVVPHALLPVSLRWPRTMRSLLEGICAQESVTVDDAVYPLVIRAGGGSPRYSSRYSISCCRVQRAAHQLPAGAGAARCDRRGVDRRRIDALAAGDAAALFGVVEAIDAGHDPRRFATDLLERFRDLIVLQSVPDVVRAGWSMGGKMCSSECASSGARSGRRTRYAEAARPRARRDAGRHGTPVVVEAACAPAAPRSASDTEWARSCSVSSASKPASTCRFRRAARRRRRVDRPEAVPPQEQASPPRRIVRRRAGAAPGLPPRPEPEPEPPV